MADHEPPQAVARWRLSPGWTLAILTAISTCGFIDRIVMNVLLQPIKTEFRATDTQMGLLTGLAFAVLNVGLSLVVARVAERSHRLRLVAVGTLLWSVATAASGMAASFAQLAFSRIGVGVGEAVGLPATQSIVSDLYPREKRTSALSVLTLAPPLGAFIGSAAGALIAEAHGWRVAFLAAAAPGVALGLLAALLIEPARGRFDDPAQAGAPIPPFGAVLARIRDRRTLRQLLAGSGIATATGFGLNVFLAAFLLRRYGFSIAQAGVVAGLVSSLPAVLSVLGSGWLSDRFGKADPRAYPLVPALSLLAAGPLYMLAVTRDAPWAAIVLLAAAAFVQYGYIAPTYGVFQNMMHPRMRASSAAVQSVVTSLVGAGLGPLIVGALSDRLAGGLPAALAIAAVGYVWAAGHYALAARHIRGEWGLPV
ncbi:MAG: MFS transporter [Sphingomonas fennica]